MDSLNEFIIGVKAGGWTDIVGSSKRISRPSSDALVVQAGAYEVTTAGALALYESGRTGGIPGPTVIVLAPGTWTSLQRKGDA